jgi:AraC-like DNA-binding protein
MKRKHINRTDKKSTYEYNPELIELSKEHQEFEIIDHGNYTLPFQRIYQVKQSKATSAKTIILPDLNSYVVYTKLLTGKTIMFFVGPRTKSVEICRSARDETILGKLPPSGIFLKKDVLIFDLVNTTHSIKSVFGEMVEERLLKSCETWSIQDKKKSKVQNLSYTPSSIGKNLDGYINHFMRKNQIPKVGVLAKSLGISARHLRNLSYELYGIPPKTVLKIKRLHNSLISQVKSQKYSQLALESGYYDQSHMIAEYQLLIGKTPKEIFQ